MRQLLLVAFLVALGYLIANLLFSRRRIPQATGGQTPPVVTQEMVRDPVCHLYLPRSEALRRRVGGQEHFFCSPSCLDKLLALHS